MHRIRSLTRVATIALSIAALTLSAQAAAIAADPSPGTGPTSGGTSISGQVPTIGFTEIATSVLSAGSAVTIGLGDDGIVYAWGDNTFGQLGNGTIGGRSLVPTAVDLPAAAIPAAHVAAGFLGGFALGADGNVYAWGSNAYGQAGNGTSGGSVLTPVAANLPAAALPASQIAGYAGGYALGADGNVYSWGQNVNGQIGNGTIGATLVTTPVRANLPVAALPVQQVTSDGNTAYARGANGAVYGWGDNSSRQLGNGNASSSFPTPTSVSLPTAALPVSDVRGTAIGAYSLGADGKVYSWGGNTSGQLGNGTIGANVPVPVTVNLPVTALPAAKIGGSGATGYAIGADGNVYAWGLGGNGQLGNGTVGSSSTPAVVSVPSAAQPVAQINGGYTAYLLNTNGDLFAWGLNTNGQIGNGSSGVNVTSPTRVPVSVVTAVTVGGVPATGLTQAPAQIDGESVISWTATTPSGCGPEDVVVSWTQTNVAQTRTFGDGFSYGAPPAFTTQPESATVSAGGDFSALVETSGDSAPTIRWQQEGPTGTWVDLPGQTTPELRITDVSSTTSYRAVAANCWGTDNEAVSQVATATVLDTHTVTFNANGGTGSMDSQSATTPTTLTANAFARTGYVFTGWNTSADGTAVAYADGDNFDFTTDTTLYAQWSAAPVRLTAAVDTAEVRRGEQQTVIGGGFAPGELVSAVMRSDAPLQIGTATADTNGAVSFTWRIPSSSLGAHAVVLTGNASGSVEASFDVIDSAATAIPEAPHPDGDLAITGGGKPLPAVVAAFSLLSAGIALLWVGRLRRRQHL
ncbi:InlB B-repeat-containing protein [Microbacterium maritypicum]|uniref:RCC1 domain-containing protein n=1 Tax=Microbacterium maritypicum TaxID=33918 RepID=UPI001B3350AB|nr:InlB B-repeat-containing protein [Microbacterium liquefaciens]MBP5800531.1 InlB B-repeat-containing protein [Microbacterium liquefaciens]